MRRVHLPQVPVLTLSAEEIRIVIAYRKMDGRRRRENLQLLECEAAEYPVRAQAHMVIHKSVQRRRPPEKLFTFKDLARGL